MSCEILHMIDKRNQLQYLEQMKTQKLRFAEKTIKFNKKRPVIYECVDHRAEKNLTRSVTAGQTKE